MPVFPRLILALAAPLLMSTAAIAQPVQGQGATFPAKVYDTWARAFGKAGGSAVAYKGTGSGDGIKQIGARAVDFGGTDAPLPAAELAKQKLVQIRCWSAASCRSSTWPEWPCLYNWMVRCWPTSSWDA